MDTRLLQTFLVLARTGSFTATAGELAVVQSTVTSQIKNLEKQLGVRLFDRLPQETQLTDAGQRLTGPARAMLDAQQHLLDAVRLADSVEGEVVIGATESVCAYRLPPVIAALAQDYPAIRVHLTPVGTKAVFKGITKISSQLDIALILDDQLTTVHSVTRISREQIKLVAAKGHPALSKEQTWQELAQYPYFLLEEGCSYTDNFVRTLENFSDRKLHITRFGSVEAARGCVLAGLGLTVLPRIAVTQQLADQSMGVVNGIPLPDVPLSLVTDQRRWTSSAAQKVREYLVNEAKNWQ